MPSKATEKTWLESTLEDKKKALYRVRSDVQKTKFALLLGKASFDEFTSREENILDVGGITCTVSLKEERVAY